LSPLITTHFRGILSLYLTLELADWGKKEEEKDDTLWDADWDDADVTDDFAKQLRFVVPKLYVMLLVSVLHSL